MHAARSPRRLVSTLALLVPAGAVVAGALPAQTVVSPHPQFATYEAELSTGYPFSYSTTAPNWLRFQQIHEDLPATPLPITQLAFRRDGVSGTAVPVRSITMTLQMAPSVAVAAASKTFAANYAAAATTVFQGQLNTPATWTTLPTKTPTDFDLPILLQVPFVYTGSGAFLWDLATTNMSATDRVNLDQATSGFALFSYSAYEMYGNGCKTANGTMELRAYGQTLGSPITGITWGVTTTSAPANASATWLIGLGKVDVPLAGLCSNVYTMPLVTRAGTTDATGKWQVFFSTPVNPLYFAVPLTMQTAALDAAQPGLPLAVSNGLVYRAAPLQPTFSAATVQGLNGNADGTLLSGRATIVRFN